MRGVEPIVGEGGAHRGDTPVPIEERGEREAPVNPEPIIQKERPALSLELHEFDRAERPASPEPISARQATPAEPLELLERDRQSRIVNPEHVQAARPYPVNPGDDITGPRAPTTQGPLPLAAARPNALSEPEFIVRTSEKGYTDRPDVPPGAPPRPDPVSEKPTNFPYTNRPEPLTPGVDRAEAVPVRGPEPIPVRDRQPVEQPNGVRTDRAGPVESPETARLPYSGPVPSPEPLGLAVRPAVTADPFDPPRRESPPFYDRDKLRKLDGPAKNVTYWY